MQEVERSALVPRPASRLFELVNDVASYPRRFNWCSRGEVLERDEHGMLARMTVSIGGMQATFSTRNEFAAPERISMRLAEGPFSHLEGLWTFTPLGDLGSRISLNMRFDFAGRLLNSALAAGFHQFADRMVDDFVRAAMADPA